MECTFGVYGLVLRIHAVIRKSGHAESEAQAQALCVIEY